MAKLSCGLLSVLVTFLAAEESLVELVGMDQTFLRALPTVWDELLTGLLVVGHHLYPGLAFIKASLYYNTEVQHSLHKQCKIMTMKKMTTTRKYISKHVHNKELIQLIGKLK